MNPWLMTENFQGDVKVYYENLFRHLSRFKNSTFVESGTLIGNGTQTALNAGFTKCLSVEIHDWCYKQAVSRFATEIASGKVKLWYGNSETMFEHMLAEVHEPATFWLDAHISAQYGAKLAKNCPVLDELQALKNHHIKNHVIMIDDCNCFDSADHDWISLSTVQRACLDINPAYKFEFLDAALPKNIMVAYVG
jgi:hypothetical protein